MTDEKRKLEPPLHLDMGFDEALRRFVQTDPAEVGTPKDKPQKISKAAKRLAARPAASAKAIGDKRR